MLSSKRKKEKNFILKVWSTHCLKKCYLFSWFEKTSTRRYFKKKKVLKNILHYSFKKTKIVYQRKKTIYFSYQRKPHIFSWIGSPTSKKKNNGRMNHRLFFYQRVLQSCHLLISNITINPSYENLTQNSSFRKCIYSFPYFTKFSFILFIG